MGYLHEGHLSLVRRAKERAPFTVVSIFVNPAQFNNKEDFEKYPIDIERDLSLLKTVGVDLVYIPKVEGIYPKDFSLKIKAGSKAEKFEGACRPGHFDGVVTVVNILFNQVQPTFAVFGEKDFQQVQVIEQMVSDLSMPVEIIRSALIREPSGLAMSSRNVRLSEEGKKIAAGIFRILDQTKQEFKTGKIQFSQIDTFLSNTFESEPGITLEYATAINDNGIPRVLFAGFVEGVRLIDTHLFS
jgi:pantoate--beta-alanine ligase